MYFMKKFGMMTVFSFAILLAASAFASDKNSLNLTLESKASVAGTPLAPGDYKIELTRNGDQVQATFISRGKTVTTKNGHIESRSSIPDGVSTVTNVKDNSILEIDAKKLKGGIVFDQVGESAATAGN
jgi:hypothetical protein